MADFLDIFTTYGMIFLADFTTFHVFPKPSKMIVFRIDLLFLKMPHGFIKSTFSAALQEFQK